MAEHPNLADALRGLTYPASKAQIVAKATENDAARDMMAVVRALPERSYADQEQVIVAARQLP